MASIHHQQATVARRAGEHALADEAAALAVRTYELSQFLVDVLGVTDVGAYFPHSVTYHPTCHSLRMLGVEPWAERGEHLLGLLAGLLLGRGDPGLPGQHVPRLPEQAGRTAGQLLQALAEERLRVATALKVKHERYDAIAAIDATVAAYREQPPDAKRLADLQARRIMLTHMSASMLARLDEVMDEHLAVRKATEELTQQLGRAPSVAEVADRLGVDRDDVEAGMDALRRFKLETTLRIAAADVAGHLPLVKVSDRLTWLAEAVLQTAFSRAYDELCASYGRPLRTDGEPAGLCALAYGKFGGIEMGYGSDLDLVFIHDCDAPDRETVGAERAIAGSTFMVRWAQRIIHWLATLTPAGRAYEVDLELRPSGRSGLAVVSVTGFADYQRREAWTWEHQALTRARPVAGSDAISAALLPGDSGASGSSVSMSSRRRPSTPSA